MHGGALPTKDITTGFFCAQTNVSPQNGLVQAFHVSEN